MNLGLYQYNVLTDNEKARILVEHGKFLMSREVDNLMISLFALFDFYVELYFTPENNETKRIRTFKNVNPLQPYLDKIEL